METRLIIAYCVCDDIVKKSNIQEKNNKKMSIAEVMVTSLAATMFFGGNHELARKFMLSGRYVSYMLSKSQFNRKLHSVPMQVWEDVFEQISQNFKKSNVRKEFIVDSFPVAVCHNVRAKRCRIYENKKYFGYTASKNEYFYGIRIHMLTAADGSPVEFLLKPASVHDSKAFKDMELEIPKRSVIYADKAYTDRKTETELFKNEKILLLAQKRSNSKIPMTFETEKRVKKKRKMIETAFSLLEKLLPKSIHAVSRKGFELKIVNFVIAMAIYAMC